MINAPENIKPTILILLIFSLSLRKENPFLNLGILKKILTKITSMTALNKNIKGLFLSILNTGNVTINKKRVTDSI